jgi:transcriptional regulator with XRE-family HTH domain
LTLGYAFGAVLREAREKQGISQERLAHDCGLDRTFISLLERGARQPSLSTVFALAKALAIAPSMLVSEVEGRLRED